MITIHLTDTELSGVLADAVLLDSDGPCSTWADPKNDGYVMFARQHADGYILSFYGSTRERCITKVFDEKPASATI